MISIGSQCGARWYDVNEYCNDRRFECQGFNFSGSRIRFYRFFSSRDLLNIRIHIETVSMQIVFTGNDNVLSDFV